MTKEQIEAAETMQEALQRIAQWSDAYPRDIFIEPDFKKAAEVLKAANMTLDAISASCMRHVVDEVGKIAKAALTAAAGVDVPSKHISEATEAGPRYGEINATIEKCALVADAKADATEGVECDMALEIGAAIRAMKDKA